jgi:hypothetical protein
MKTILKSPQTNGISLRLHSTMSLQRENLKYSTCILHVVHSSQTAILSYNQRYKGRWEFSGLHEFFAKDATEDERKKFFSSTLPSIVKLALRLPELVKIPIPLLHSGMDRSILLSQEQISCLLGK